MRPCCSGRAVPSRQGSRLHSPLPPVLHPFPAHWQLVVRRYRIPGGTSGWARGERGERGNQADFKSMLRCKDIDHDGCTGVHMHVHMYAVVCVRRAWLGGSTSTRPSSDSMSCRPQCQGWIGCVMTSPCPVTMPCPPTTASKYFSASCRWPRRSSSSTAAVVEPKPLGATRSDLCDTTGDRKNDTGRECGMRGLGLVLGSFTRGYGANGEW
jgi:hypothetical protein